VSPSKQLHFVVPAGIDDPERPSGGNRYDRRLSCGLAAAGWDVLEHGVPGAWPCPDDAGRRALSAALAAPPDGALTLVDGLLASDVPDLLLPAARRLRLVVLLHMPLGGHGEASRAREHAVLTAATATLTTSEWVRCRLLTAYSLDPARVHAAPPGTDVAEPVSGTRSGGNLLFVGSVTPGKGLDVLVTALSRTADLPWQCLCVGAVVRAPGFVADLERVIEAWGLARRVHLTGPLTGPALEEAYAGADVLVLPSRSESYGMVVAEALARGLPVLASEVGGVPEALGTAADGRRPGLLVPPGDTRALVTALRGWLSDAELRDELRAAARDRRDRLTGWDETAGRVDAVLQGVAA
jgi:glycosyltransferase involved in cell wall biosynthesis